MRFTLNRPNLVVMVDIEMMSQKSATVFRMIEAKQYEMDVRIGVDYVTDKGVQIMVNLVHTKTIDPILKNVEEMSHVLALVKEAYKLAEVFEMQELQNALIDHLRRIKRLDSAHPEENWHTLSAVLDCCEKDLMHSTLYDYILDSAVYGHMRYGMDEEYHGAFEKVLDRLLDYPRALRDLVSGMERFSKYPWENLVLDSGCRYHKHDEGMVCAFQTSEV